MSSRVDPAGTGPAVEGETNGHASDASDMSAAGAGPAGKSPEAAPKSRMQNQPKRSSSVTKSDWGSSGNDGVVQMALKSRQRRSSVMMPGKAIKQFRNDPGQETTYTTAIKSRTTLACIETAAALLSTLFVVLDLEMPEHTDGWRGAISFLTLVIIWCTYNEMEITNVLFQNERFFKPGAPWFLQEGAFSWVVLLLLKLWHIPPGVSKEHISPKWQMVAFIRLVAVLSLAREYCPTVRSNCLRTVSYLTKVELGNSLVFKWYIKVYPFRIFVGIYTTLIVLFGYIVFVIERTDREAIEEFGGAMQDRGFFDYMWLIVVTIFTVGYGDIYPVTYVGRTVMWIVMMCGVVTTSLLISAISDFMELKTVEARILSYATRQEAKQHMVEVGARLIQIAWRDSQTNKKKKKRGHSFLFYHALRQWKRARTKARSSDTSGPLSREIRIIDLHNNLQDVRTELSDVAQSTHMIAKQMLALGLTDTALAARPSTGTMMDKLLFGSKRGAGGDGSGDTSLTALAGSVEKADARAADGAGLERAGSELDEAKLLVRALKAENARLREALDGTAAGAGKASPAANSLTNLSRLLDDT